ncbi:GCN5-related N-acetyltransferase [Beijerinckiaceae bacterium RH AL1]|nr:N-acetyltransferase [Beijerinckiaceae bacterium]VVB43891.1 GCN5-related N-acetyltransferase [Beijerinckiaceae bacterium RH CH11]VVB43917.1 GCN5-related N-acetyltransferase [Beijerinckiaceae bacterium RH AL8]VVC54065.1 GCN5-related N-acetyltransferase [Beijerinckiaceae bacterium RH AL1]
MSTISTHDPAAAFVPAPQLQAGVDPVWIDAERPEDRDAREMLLDRAFGPSRFGKTCERLRAQRLPAAGLSLVARAHDYGLGGGEVVGTELVGTVRLWHVEAGGVPALMLGPLAVDAGYRRFGIGARLMEAAIERATALGHQAILLVGDAPYYARFGFGRAPTLALRMPGPVEADRFLGLELRPGALARARGAVRATGALDLAARRVRLKPKLKKAA